MTMMTRHASVDRFDRISKIIDLLNGDFGETIIRVRDDRDGNWQELTTNGVFVVKGRDNVIITMFLCSVKQANYMIAASGKMLTKNQWRRIRDNQKYIAECQ